MVFSKIFGTRNHWFHDWKAEEHLSIICVQNMVLPPRTTEDLARKSTWSCPWNMSLWGYDSFPAPPFSSSGLHEHLELHWNIPLQPRGSTVLGTESVFPVQNVSMRTSFRHKGKAYETSWLLLWAPDPEYPLRKHKSQMQDDTLIMQKDLGEVKSIFGSKLGFFYLIWNLCMVMISPSCLMSPNFWGRVLKRQKD